MLTQHTSSSLTHLFSDASFSEYCMSLKYQCKNECNCKGVIVLKGIYFQGYDVLFVSYCKMLFMHKCFLPVFLFLILSCPKHALVWGNYCERLHEIFVRVLCSSRVNLSNVNDTNVCCCVWIESPFYLFSVAVLNSVLQKQCW